MARVLEGAGMRDVLPLAKARVPVVKCINPETGTKVGSIGQNLLSHAHADLLSTVWPSSAEDDGHNFKLMHELRPQVCSCGPESYGDLSLARLQPCSPCCQSQSSMGYV